MPPRKNRKRSVRGRPSAARGGARRSPDTKGPGVSATAYNGPLVIRAGPQDRDTVLVRLIASTPASTNSGGLMSYALGNSPAVTSEFSSYVGLYQEYRVCSFKVTYSPNYQNFAGPVAIQSAPMLMVVNRNSTTPAPTSYNIFSASSSRIGNVQRPMFIGSRADGTYEMGWVNTTAPAASWTVTVFAGGLTITTVYGILWMEMMVQFRNRA